jgi:hypothetical protein
MKKTFVVSFMIEAEYEDMSDENVAEEVEAGTTMLIESALDTRGGKFEVNGVTLTEATGFDADVA